MKRTIIFCMLTLVSVATWAGNALSPYFNNLPTVLLWIVGLVVVWFLLRFIFRRFSRSKNQIMDIIEMPEILKRVIAKIHDQKAEYFETIIKRNNYPDWVIDKIDTISTELDKDDFFDSVEMLIFKAQLEKSFESQKLLYADLIAAEMRIRNVMRAIHAIMVQNCMYQHEARMAITSVADHLKDLRSQKVDISAYNIRLQKLANLFEADEKNAKEVFDGCKQMLKEINAL